ncbi:MAG: 2-phospho-L-lactate transferase [Candidatus Caldarchaeum sp.]
MTALAGGVGGSKLVTGLCHVIHPDIGTVVVNTADDETFYGLYVSPDVDTMLYQLAGVGDDVKGWGIKDDTFNTLEMLGRLGLETWFKIGDRDLAIHLYRTNRLNEGASLTQVTAELAEKLGVRWRILPMSNDPVKTIVETENGIMPFQTYFVKHGHSILARGIRFQGIEKAKPTKEVITALSEAEYIIIPPSNPVVSIGPILALSGVRDLLRNSGATILAVSPIVRGQALRGPAAELMKSLGHDPSPVGVAEMYCDFLDILVFDTADEELVNDVKALGVKPLTTRTIMERFEDRVKLAEFCLKAVGYRS